MTRNVFFGLVLTATTFASATFAADTYELKYKLAEGDVLRSKVTHLVNVTTKIQGNSQTAQSRTVSTKNWKVEKIDDEGNITLVHSIEDLQLWNKVTDRPEQVYDSTSPEPPSPIFQRAAQSVGVPLSRFTISKNGFLVEREELQESAHAPFNQVTVVLPAEPVEIGAKWDSPTDVQIRTSKQQLKKVKTRQLFTLESVVNGVATIDMKTQILTPIENPEIKVELIQQLANGKVKFDIDAGRVMRQDLDMDETVIGFQGEASMMKFRGRMQEELLTEPLQAAVAPTPPKPEFERTAEAPTPAKRPEEATEVE
ncbi:DUF6263 family protein [Blastopirellula retiformator]|uniref:Uncharacterized protein n=1 Tax=Blastopirellula retiformator TaxID=2527970 RepID=A0A5C5V0Z8_9BACT|nr:DUF6263 family protein [Blastopirellula retiformator]TWT31590.1 hypothetical protein Enr8_35120 [Blastopirellula retiformator]